MDFFVSTKNFGGGCVWAPVLGNMAAAVLGVVKEHLDCFPDADADALFSATQLLKQAKSYFNIDMRQELLGWAKVCASVQRMQAYHSKGRPITLSHWAKHVWVCKDGIWHAWQAPVNFIAAVAWADGGSDHMRQLLSPCYCLISA